MPTYTAQVWQDHAVAVRAHLSNVVAVAGGVASEMADADLAYYSHQEALTAAVRADTLAAALAEDP